MVYVGLVQNASLIKSNNEIVNLDTANWKSLLAKHQMIIKY